MKAVIRNGFFSAALSLSLSLSLSARSLTSNPNPIFSHRFPRYGAVSRFPFTIPARFRSCSADSSSPMSTGGEMASPTTEKLEKQFEDFRNDLEGSGNLRDRIRAVATEIESTTRLMHSSLLLVHQTRPVAEIVEKTKAQIDVLRELFSKLAEIIRESPGEYYRYHGDWRSETQSVVSMLAFKHWLETGALLLHAEAEETLGLNSSEFGLDIEDYLVGICFMSNELPRYVVNQVTAGDYDCPRKVLKFLTDLHASFRMLNLRNDFLRKKFDGMKYDLRKVEEIHYDVKIRGLTSNGGAEVAKEEAKEQ